MEVTIKLFASLRKAREKEYKIRIGKNSNIACIINQLELPGEEISIIMVNGIRKDLDYLVKENDIISFFPAVGGG